MESKHGVKEVRLPSPVGTNQRSESRDFFFFWFLNFVGRQLEVTTFYILQKMKDLFSCVLAVTLYYF